MTKRPRRGVSSRGRSASTRRRTAAKPKARRPRPRRRARGKRPPRGKRHARPTRRAARGKRKVLGGRPAPTPSHMFCPKCGSLLFPTDGKFLCAKCGYERGITSGDTRTARVLRRDERPSEMLVLDDVTDTMPKTHVDCPKCGNGEAYWVMRQTRAADEPTTRIYRCT